MRRSRSGVVQAEAQVRNGIAKMFDVVSKNGLLDLVENRRIRRAAKKVVRKATK